jgi:hypothetical protein
MDVLLVDGVRVAVQKQRRRHIDERPHEDFVPGRERISAIVARDTAIVQSSYGDVYRAL